MDEEEGQEADDGRELGGMDVDDGDEGGEDGLPISSIDAYWLQRETSKAFDNTLDAQAAQKMADDVMGVLASSDEAGVENALVLLLCAPPPCNLPSVSHYSTPASAPRAWPAS